MANTGDKIVLTLRKYVNGAATGETKINSVGDPDYIAPYADTVTCPIGGGGAIATTTTTTTVAPTTTTTTVLQNFASQYISANCSSTTGGTYNDGVTTHAINSTITFSVPTTDTFNIVLTANFTTGPSSVSCYSRIDKSDFTLAYGQGQVSASVSTPTNSDSDLGVSLTAGTYTMFIYGAECGGGSSLGSLNLSLTKV